MSGVPTRGGVERMRGEIGRSGGGVALLRAYAEKRGWAIEEFTDEGVSGAARTRPALDQMMVGVRKGGSSTS